MGLVHVTRPSNDGGAIAVLVAIFAVIMFVFGAYVVELGTARESRRTAQNAADQAALAAAGEMYDGPTLDLEAAVAAAKNIGWRNAFNPEGLAEPVFWNGCATTPPAGWTTSYGGVDSGTECIVFRRGTGLEAGTEPTQIRVVTPGVNTPGFFGAVATDVRAVAHADTRPGAAGLETPACVLCVLGNLTGTRGFIKAFDGDVLVNGRLEFAVPTGIVGGVAVDNGIIGAASWGTGDFEPPPRLGGFPDDVFQAVPPPDIDATSPPRPDVGICGPGNYLSISVCTSFSPGVFVVMGDSTSPAQTLAGGGSDVLFYFTCQEGSGPDARPSPCAPDEVGASFRGASVPVTVSGRVTGDQEHRGFSMIFDPSNEAGHSFVGAGALVVNGTIFSGSPDAVFSNGNTPDTGRFESNGIVIVGSMQVNRAASNLRFDPPGAVTIPDGSPEGAVRLIK